jgi:4-aminobutyrate aminotransferase-like enzyme
MGALGGPALAILSAMVNCNQKTKSPKGVSALLISFWMSLAIGFAASNSGAATALVCRTAHANKTSSSTSSSSTWIKPETLLQVAILAHENIEALDHMPEPLRLRLKSLANGSLELNDEIVFRRLVQNLSALMGSERVEAALGKNLRATKKAIDARIKTDSYADLLDMGRTWGWKLLPEDDPIFSNPEYFYWRQTTSGMSGAGGFFGGDRSLDLFRKEWSQIAPKNTQVERFTVTGAQANNLIYDIAKIYVRNGVRKAGAEPNFLALSGAWVASDGSRASQLHMGVPDRDKLVVESPLTTVLNPTDPAEIARLEPLEDRALAAIEAKAQDSKLQVGAVLIEPILAARGVYFYRTEFLLRLRELCDRLRIPIVADEIFTGGGRTGKFFGYQHYGDFEPDFVTFGKGLLVAGIASVHRENAGAPFRFPLNQGSTTTAIPDSLVKSAFLMRRIREGHLMENAEKLGAYILQKLRDAEDKYLRAGGTLSGSDKSDIPNSYLSRGIGLMFRPGRYARRLGRANAPNHRMTPYLSISKSQIDDLFSGALNDKIVDQPRREILSQSSSNPLTYILTNYRSNSPNFMESKIQDLARRTGADIKLKTSIDGQFQLHQLLVSGSPDQVEIFQASFDSWLKKEKEEGFKVGQVDKKRIWTSQQVQIFIDLKVNSSKLDEDGLYNPLSPIFTRFGGTYDIRPGQLENERTIWIAVDQRATDDAVAYLSNIFRGWGRMSLSILEADEEPE